MYQNCASETSTHKLKKEEVNMQVKDNKNDSKDKTSNQNVSNKASQNNKLSNNAQSERITI